MKKQVVGVRIGMDLLWLVYYHGKNYHKLTANFPENLGNHYMEVNMAEKDRNQDFVDVEAGIESAPSSDQTTQEASNTVEDNTELADKLEKVSQFSQIHGLDKDEQEDLEKLTKEEHEQQSADATSSSTSTSTSTSTGTGS